MFIWFSSSHCVYNVHHTSLQCKMRKNSMVQRWHYKYPINCISKVVTKILQLRPRSVSQEWAQSRWNVVGWFQEGPRRKCHSVWPGSGMKQSRLLFLKPTSTVNSNPRLLPSGSKPRRREERRGRRPRSRRGGMAPPWRRPSRLPSTPSMPPSSHQPLKELTATAPAAGGEQAGVPPAII
jgi:hypothetical protein